MRGFFQETRTALNLPHIRTTDVSIMDLFLIFAIALMQFASAQREEVMIIRKCCAKGEQLRQDLKTCVPIPGVIISSQIQNEHLSPPIDISLHSWVPNVLRNKSFVVIYNMLPHIRMDMITVRVLNGSEREQPVEMQGNINNDFLGDEQDCFDKTEDENKMLVVMTSYKMNGINKCCAKGERLDAQGSVCVAIAGVKQHNVEQEVVGLPRKHDHYSWLPANVPRDILKIHYNFLKMGFVMNTMVLGTSDFHWQVIDEQPFGNTVISFAGKDVTGKEVAGATDIFCFDETTEGWPHPRVLLVTLYYVTKCCKGGEQLKHITPWDMVIRQFSEDTASCEARPGLSVKNYANGFVNWRNDSKTSFWLPNSQRNNIISVRYDVLKIMSFHEHTMIFFDENKWTLTYDNQTRLPKLIFNLTDFYGRRLALTSFHFCFDFIESLGNVVVTYIPKPKYSITKCCLSSERLSPKAACEKHDGVDWSAEVSPFYTERREDLLEEATLYTPVHHFCLFGSLEVLPFNTALSVFHFEERPFVKNKGSLTSYCNDWQRTSGGGIREVVGACTFPALAAAHDKVPT